MRDHAVPRQRKSNTLDREVHDKSTHTEQYDHSRPKKPFQKSRNRRKHRSLLHRCRRFATKHTWAFPLFLVFAFLSLYAVNPTDSNMIHHFIFLSYRLSPSTASSQLPQYGKGPWDIAFVFFYTIVLSFTREFIMQRILRPLSRHYGLKSRSKQARFMEQMYTAIYFAPMGLFGLYVMRRTPVWYFNTRGMYELFPHKTHESVVKFYYLFQAAYWAQQAIVLLLVMEKPRRDFKELVGHHIVTLTLIALSYCFHFTYMGIAVYLTHDISDFFLAVSYSKLDIPWVPTNKGFFSQTSKTLNYLDSPPYIQGPYFTICIAFWIYLRHYLNLRIIFSLFSEFKTVGPYQLNWETEQYKSPLSNVIALLLLSFLQALNIFWLYCLLRNAYRFVVYRIAKDDRSEDEEFELEEQESRRRLRG